MKKALTKFLVLILFTALFVRCAEDDGGGTATIPQLTLLNGDWIDEDVPSGTTNGGLIAFSFTSSDSSATVFAASPNDAGIVCESLLFRNIAPASENTFTGEGLIGSNYEAVTLSIIDENTISITWDCTSCTPAVDMITRITEGSEPVPIKISEDITEETTFYDIVCDPDVPDYIVTRLIAVREHLTILPGVHIAFEANAGMDITDVNSNGSLSAVGTGPDQILFTGTTKEPGFWRGLSFESNDTRNRLRWSTVQYAGSDPIVTYGTNIALRGAVAIESESGFNGRLSVERSTISYNLGNGMIVEEGAILEILDANVFINNTESALRINADNVGAINAFTDFNGGFGGVGTNGFNGIEINASGSLGHGVNSDATWPALAGGATYRVAQSINVNAELTIQPGAVIEFEADQTMYFKQDFLGPDDGIIIAKGTASEPITFTGVEKTAGYWKGLVIQSNSLINEIDHCIVEYGGSDLVVNESGNIVLDKDGAFNDPDLTVTNSIIRHSGGCGIAVDVFGGNLVQSDNTFTNNVGSSSPQCF